MFAMHFLSDSTSAALQFPPLTVAANERPLLHERPCGPSLLTCTAHDHRKLIQLHLTITPWVWQDNKEQPWLSSTPQAGPQLLSVSVKHSSHEGSTILALDVPLFNHAEGMTTSHLL